MSPGFSPGRSSTCTRLDAFSLASSIWLSMRRSRGVPASTRSGRLARMFSGLWKRASSTRMFDTLPSSTVSVTVPSLPCCGGR